MPRPPGADVAVSERRHGMREGRAYEESCQLEADLLAFRTVEVEGHHLGTQTAEGMARRLLGSDRAWDLRRLGLRLRMSL
jgi:hypothetical protein